LLSWLMENVCLVTTDSFLLHQPGAAILRRGHAIRAVQNSSWSGV